MSGVGRQESGLAPMLLVATALLPGLLALASLLPLAPCPVCPPDIFTIMTSIAPGAPITDPIPVDCVCRDHGGRVGFFVRWRTRLAMGPTVGRAEQP